MYPSNYPPNTPLRRRYIDTIIKPVPKVVLTAPQTLLSSPSNNLPKSLKKRDVVLITMVCLFVVSLGQFLFSLHKNTETIKAQGGSAKILENSPKKQGSRLIVQKLNIDVPIVFVDSRQNEDVLEGLKGGVVRYGQTANPGETGNSFIVGHSSNYAWAEGDYKQVFANLDSLSLKDEAMIYYQGQKYTYETIEKKVISPNDFSAVEQTSDKRITLMTCWPIGTTENRLVVIFKQVNSTRL